MSPRDVERDLTGRAATPARTRRPAKLQIKSHPLLNLQRQVGNQATVHLLQRAPNRERREAKEAKQRQAAAKSMTTERFQSTAQGIVAPAADKMRQLETDMRAGRGRDSFLRGAAQAVSGHLADAELAIKTYDRRTHRAKLKARDESSAKIKAKLAANSASAPRTDTASKAPGKPITVEASGTKPSGPPRFSMLGETDIDDAKYNEFFDPDLDAGEEYDTADIEDLTRDPRERKENE